MRQNHLSILHLILNCVCIYTIIYIHQISLRLALQGWGVGAEIFVLITGVYLARYLFCNVSFCSFPYEEEGFVNEKPRSAQF